MNFIEEIIADDLNSGRIKKVITRFPPEPNGYLHIGHAKSICLNFGLAIKYEGKCNLRFDDTNPQKEDVEYCNAIINDIKWLGFDFDVYYSSDYFQFMYECAVKLIKKGKAYVCELTADQIREYRGTLTEKGKDSPYRNRSTEENLKLFEDMRQGKFADATMTLRAKIDMSSPNINMRDPVIYRVLRATHHRQKDKWCIYPIYDFAHPIEDAVEHISHSICTLEFEDHRPLYDWVINECELVPAPHQYEFARLNMTRTIMSKRYLKKLVEEGVVEGWDDPRMPTIAGLCRRGYPPEAIRQFCDKIGVSKANSEVDAEMLEHCVRDVLNEKANRVMAIKEPLKVVLTDYSKDSETLVIENHPNNEASGTREVTFSREFYIEKEDFKLIPPPKYHRLVKGGLVRLKGAYIIKCDDVILDEKGEPKELICSYFPESKSGEDKSGLKVKGVIQWVDRNNNYPIVINDFDYLLNADDGEKKDFSERININSKIVYANAIAEKSLETAQIGVAYQFIRNAYYCLDSKKKGVFNQIVGLKDSYKG